MEDGYVGLSVGTDLRDCGFDCFSVGVEEGVCDIGIGGESAVPPMYRVFMVRCRDHRVVNSSSGVVSYAPDDIYNSPRVAGTVVED